MKVSELIAALQHMTPDDEVVVKVTRSSPSIGPSATVDIDAVVNGFDWDTHRVFLGVSETVYAGLDRFEAAVKFARTVRNALYLRKKSKHFEQRDAIVIQAIELGLDRWLPKRSGEELFDPAEPPK